MHRRLSVFLVLLAVATALGACGSSTSKAKKSASPTSRTAAPPVETTQSPTTTAAAPTRASVPPRTATTHVTAASTTAPPTAPSAPAPTFQPAPVAAAGGSRVVVIDPGHNGGTAGHSAELNRLVDIGVGLKPCNNTGTQTNDGYPEHAFNWDVAARVAARLRAKGVTVILTRPDDNGWGPCSVDRAAIANRAHALATVSIHADGGPPGGRGFHVIEPALLAGLTDDIYSASARLGTALHAAVASETPMPPSSYAGHDGYQVRSDLGGLDRADVPAVFVECGNMRNATDATLLKSAAFREQLAGAIADGILRFIAH